MKWVDDFQGKPKKTDKSIWNPIYFPKAKPSVAHPNFRLL